MGGKQAKTALPPENSVEKRSIRVSGRNERKTQNRRTEDFPLPGSARENQVVLTLEILQIPPPSAIGLRILCPVLIRRSQVRRGNFGGLVDNIVAEAFVRPEVFDSVAVNLLLGILT